MSDLTDRQLEIFTLIYESARDKGFQPTIREMMPVFGIASENGIHCHLKALAKRGYLRLEREARALRILRRPDGSRFEGFQDKPTEPKVEAFQFESEYA